MIHSSFDKDFFIQKIMIYDQDVFRFLCSITGNSETAQDLKQNTLEKAWRKLDQLREPERAKGWIFSIAYNEAMQFYRKNAQCHVYEIEEEYIVNSADNLNEVKDEIAEIVINRFERETMGQALCLLEVKYQRLIRMRYVEDFSLKEIAEVLDLNYSTVRVYIGRALDKLKEIYNQLERGEA